MSRDWNMSTAEKETYLPCIAESLATLEENEEFHLEGTTLNICNVEELLQMLGYEEADEPCINGWQMDYCHTYKKGNIYITVCGCGLTFSLYLIKEKIFDF